MGIQSFRTPFMKESSDRHMCGKIFAARFNDALTSHRSLPRSPFLLLVGLWPLLFGCFVAVLGNEYASAWLAGRFGGGRAIGPEPFAFERSADREPMLLCLPTLCLLSAVI